MSQKTKLMVFYRVFFLIQIVHFLIIGVIFLTILILLYFLKCNFISQNALLFKYLFKLCNCKTKNNPTLTFAQINFGFKIPGLFLFLGSQRWIGL